MQKRRANTNICKSERCNKTWNTKIKDKVWTCCYGDGNSKPTQPEKKD